MVSRSFTKAVELELVSIVSKVVMEFARKCEPTKSQQFRRLDKVLFDVDRMVIFVGSP